MHYAAFIVALALAESSQAWYNNSTAIPVGSASGVSSSNPTSTGTIRVYASGASSGLGSYPSKSLSTGGSFPLSGASGSGYGGPPPVTPSSPPMITSVTVPGVPTTITLTNLITTTGTEIITKFVPCSTAVATSGGHTFYSSSLTTSLVTSAATSIITEYTVICPAPTSSPGSGSGSANGGGSSGETCPQAETVYQTVEVVKTVTVMAPAGQPQTQIPDLPVSSGSASSPSQQASSSLQGPYQQTSNVVPFPIPSNSNSQPSVSGGSAGPANPTGMGTYAPGTGSPRRSSTGAWGTGTSIAMAMATKY